MACAKSVAQHTQHGRTVYSTNALYGIKGCAFSAKPACCAGLASYMCSRAASSLSRRRLLTN